MRGKSILSSPEDEQSASSTESRRLDESTSFVVTVDSGSKFSWYIEDSRHTESSTLADALDDQVSEKARHTGTFDKLRRLVGWSELWKLPMPKPRSSVATTSFRQDTVNIKRYFDKALGGVEDNRV